MGAPAIHVRNNTPTSRETAPRTTAIHRGKPLHGACSSARIGLLNGYVGYRRWRQRPDPRGNRPLSKTRSDSHVSGCFLLQWRHCVGPVNEEQRRSRYFRTPRAGRTRREVYCHRKQCERSHQLYSAHRTKTQARFVQRASRARQNRRRSQAQPLVTPGCGKRHASLRPHSGKQTA